VIDFLLSQGIVLNAPYNPRNTNDPTNYERGHIQPDVIQSSHAKVLTLA
jgi:hypothetical protein